LAGAARFAIEFIRINTRVLGPLTVAHVVALSMMIVGTFLMRTAFRIRNPVRSVRL
jgi:prolipoprotein diacylglyceryltransferase